MTTLRTISILLLSLYTSQGFSLALGEIQLDSFYNEPFNAKIPLILEKSENRDSIMVHIADKLAFANAGLKKQSSLENLHFSIKDNGAREQFIHVTSDSVMNDLYLDFVLDVESDTQRLSRNLTVLLDPRELQSSKKNRQVIRTAFIPESKQSLKKSRSSHSMESHSMDATVDKAKASHSMESHNNI